MRVLLNSNNKLSHQGMATETFLANEREREREKETPKGIYVGHRCLVFANLQLVIIIQRFIGG